MNTLQHPLSLGIDMGGTATRWVMRGPQGAVVARGLAPGATALPDPAARAVFVQVLAQIADAAPAGLHGAVLGLTGSGLNPDDGLITATAAALDLEPGRITVLNDVVLAWHATHPQGGGHLVAAGTGSVGISIDTSGAITLVGGRGSLIDDGGSGAWIALRALDALWRAIDTHGSPVGVETLATHLFAAIGGPDWDATQRFVYAGDRGRIGTLAAAVADAARACDPTALDLMPRAGQELARLAQALITRCGPAPVAVIGGVLALHPAIQTALVMALPGVSLRFPTADVAAHAAMMAQSTFHHEAP